MRGRPGSQEGALSAGENSREIPGLDTRRAMPNPIDTSMDGEQRAPLESRPDLRRRHPVRQQVRSGDDAVRTAGEPGHQLVDRAAFLLHTDSKLRRSRLRPRSPASQLLRDSSGVPSLPVSPPSRHPTLRLILPVALMAAALALPAGTAQAKVRSSVSGSLLVIRGGKAADRAKVACAGGLAKVNGKNPRKGPVACSRISEVDALMGDGNDRVDLSGVGANQGFGQRDLPGGFGHGTGCGAALGAGDDRYAGGGSCFN